VVGPAPQGAIVVENRYSAFIALHDVSKSQTVTRLAPWWTDVHSPGEAFRDDHCADGSQGRGDLWRYTGNAHKKAGLPGRITLDAKWYIGNELPAYGRKPADYDPAAFRGIHAGRLLDDLGDRLKDEGRSGIGVEELEW
jgi:hypothetical protein